MFMKYSIALTLIKGLSPKILNQVYALDQNEKELFEKITQNYSCNANKTLDRASQIIEDCLEIPLLFLNAYLTCLLAFYQDFWSTLLIYIAF